LKKVRPKKHLGQHFLTDLSIAEDIVKAFNRNNLFRHALEVGSGMGVLTQFLDQKNSLDLKIVEIDNRSVNYLREKTNLKPDQIIEKSFLELDLNSLYKGEKIGVIGNFPYNISSQILFKTLDYKSMVIEVVGMFQKEVAERIAAREGSKIYGITSVLLQAFYDIEYLFTVESSAFHPPPKVQSAVIRLRRNGVNQLSCDEKKFKSVVKTAFNQRRKTLRNSLKSMLGESLKADPIFQLRPEQLSVAAFIALCHKIEAQED